MMRKRRPTESATDGVATGRTKPLTPVDKLRAQRKSSLKEREKPTVVRQQKCPKASFSIAASGYFWKTRNLGDFENI